MTILAIFALLAVFGLLEVRGECHREERLKVENWNAARRKRGEK